MSNGDGSQSDPDDLHDRSYYVWNARVALFWLAQPFLSTDVYLTITPRGLATAAWECDGERLTPQEAEHDLIEAVRRFYRAHVVHAGADIGSLAQLTADNSAPLCLAFLAFAVLAAYHMHADAKNRATAYWARLCELLGVGEKHGRPMGISNEGFKAVWLYVRDWTKTAKMTPLFVPDVGGVVRKYTAYPLAHVALRQVDLERLPNFFAWADYAPGALVAPERLRADFHRWVHDRAELTKQGREAFADTRADAVLQEVAQELKGWEGASRDAAGQGVAQVELSLDLVRGMPHLSYLARRPPGFPEVFDDGTRTFDSLDEGWYDPVPIPVDDGDLLLQGFEWPNATTGNSVVLHRRGVPAIAFVRSEDYTGWTSRRRLLEGVSCSVLYHESVAAIVERRVREIAAAAPTHFQTVPSLPAGWRLFADFVVRQGVAQDVAELEALEVDAAVEFMTVGGLRLGRRTAWLTDSPPKLTVSGAHGDVLVDRKPVKVASDGTVHWSQLCRTPGMRVVESGRSHRRIELVEPQLAADLLRFGETGRWVTFVPPGDWSVVGARAVEFARFQTKGESLAHFAFEPIWAVSRLNGGVALYLVEDERSPARPSAHSGDAENWISTLLNANRRRMVVASFTHCSIAIRSWRRFIEAATELNNAARGGAS